MGLEDGKMPNFATRAIFYDGIAPEQLQRLICTLMCRSLGMEVAKAIKYARIINPALGPVSYVAAGWNAGLFNLITETLSLFK